MILDSTISAIETWRTRVEKHHAQSESVMEESLRQGDFWQSLAPRFKADPYRNDDEILNSLVELVAENTSVLDVGGGAGRFAIPLALHCKQVTVVDPSPSMLAQLDDSVSEVEGICVKGVYSEWETAEVEAADIALCAHVVYGVADIQPFIQKLQGNANQKVVIVLFVDSPQAGLAPLWEPVYGEKRVNLPALPELMNVLWEMEIYPNVRMMATDRTRVFESVEAAIEETRNRLFIGSNRYRLQSLGDSIESYLEETDGGYRIKGARPVRQGVVWWDVAR